MSMRRLFFSLSVFLFSLKARRGRGVFVLGKLSNFFFGRVKKVTVLCCEYGVKKERRKERDSTSSNESNS